MRVFHVVFYANRADYYSVGKNYTTDKTGEVEAVKDILDQWEEEYPAGNYPDKQFFAIHPVQVI